MCVRACAHVCVLKIWIPGTVVSVSAASADDLMYRYPTEASRNISPKTNMMDSRSYCCFLSGSHSIAVMHARRMHVRCLRVYEQRCVCFLTGEVSVQ